VASTATSQQAVYRVRSRAEQRSNSLPVFSRILNQLGEPIAPMRVAPASERARWRGYQRRPGRENGSAGAEQENRTAEA